MNTDVNKPESVVNLTGNRNAVLATAFASFAVGTFWLWSLVTGQVSISEVQHHRLRQQAKLGVRHVLCTCLVICRLFMATRG